MAEEDQDARKSNDWDKVRAVDAQNVTRLKEIVATYGWPTITLVGHRGSDDAWLLIQHADRDVSFQKRCLVMIDSLRTRGEVHAWNYAYLYDRVAMNEDRPQRFGTQGRCMDNGLWQPHVLEDVDNVDSLRAVFGLKPLAEYQEHLHGVCEKIRQ